MLSVARQGLRPLGALGGFFRAPNIHRNLLKVPPCAIRGLSTETTTPQVLEWTDITPTIVETITTEPTFTSIGLGGWTPPGIAQSCLEYLHISHHLPWWGTIVVGTICVRLLIFPVVIATQRHSAKFQNVLPQLMHLQKKFTEARRFGDRVEAERYAEEINIFMKEKSVNPLKNLLAPMASMPFFISFFLGLKGMAGCPVDSLKDGGLFWFEDLSVPDQFYGLPIFTSLTLALTIELGVDTGKMNHENAKIMKYVFRAIPVIMLPFSSQFPAAILCYWASTNVFSLCQVGFLKIPAVREYFKIPKVIPSPQAPIDTAPKKNFVEGFKESWENVQITKALEERKQMERAISEKHSMTSIQAKKAK